MTKTTALMIAIAVALAAPAAAETKKRAAKPAMSEAQKTNDASWRLVRDSLPIWLPSWAQPIYQSTQKKQQPVKKAKAAQ